MNHKYNLRDRVAFRVNKTKRCPGCESGYIDIPFEGMISHEKCKGTGLVQNLRPFVFEGQVDAIILDKGGISYRLALSTFDYSELIIREDDIDGIVL